MSNDAATVTDGRNRPDPPYAAPDGSHWQAVPAENWSPAEPGTLCRYRGTDPRACGEGASVAVERGVKKGTPWNYCAADAFEHYGVWLQDGKVLTWELRDGPEP